MSFIYLSESQLGHHHDRTQSPKSQSSPRASVQSSPSKTPRSSSHQTDATSPPGEYEMGRVNRLFEILTARSDIDYPICIECTDMLVDGLQRKLDTAARTRDAYAAQLKEMRAAQPSEADKRAARERRRKADGEREAAMRELKRLEAEKDALDEEILALEDESRQLDKEEAAFWDERNAFAAKMADFQAERDSVNTKYSNDSQLLQKLQRTNVYNDTFCISHDGSFATINSLRLGRLSSKPVDWPEINAAWGHALLLLVTVADKLEFRFQGYEPQPMGSTSKIVRLDAASPAASRVGGHDARASSSSRPPPAPKRNVLELYSSGGDLPLGLRLLHRSFDNAMVAFLELVRQLGEHIHRTTRGSERPLSLPYRIDGDKIDDVSIRLGIAQDDGWTKACKLTLTCCKFLLAHASNVSAVTRDADS
ncbi:Autophagy-related protein 6 [Cordyceps fumosorosea ARSEF 2679]|uniref:Autophagy-related protein 6 n=1 Tax=Cordyceps fumosorosea (strain ARSEF 2679) TaxID=1081104 RepID=A0A168ALY6_CORFA|nr:Autophagy-related protein 6 [Cordyceps fumosorosea ARSEF 2679]OAA68923.1 Autophagy-related protein 6 [Cordyceps fumosorosea ARSEF 2679]